MLMERTALAEEDGSLAKPPREAGIVRFLLRGGSVGEGV